MSFRKKTIRKLPPKTREIAKIINEVESVVRRIKNRLPEIASLELDSQALSNAKQMLSLEPERKQVRKSRGKQTAKTNEPEQIFAESTDTSELEEIKPSPEAELVHALPKEHKKRGKSSKAEEPPEERIDDAGDITNNQEPSSSTDNC